MAEQRVAGFVEGRVGGRLGAPGQVCGKAGGEAAGQQGEDQQHDGQLDQGEAVRVWWTTIEGHGLQGMHRATSVDTAASLLAKGRTMRSGSPPNWPAARAARVGASR